MKGIEAGSLSVQLAKLLSDYQEDVIEVVKKTVDKNAEMTADAIRKRAPKRKNGGRYLRAFRLQTSFESRTEKRKTWFVKPPYYRLTHLLENEHLKRNRKGMVKAIPHVKYGLEIAEKLDEMIAEGIESL